MVNNPTQVIQPIANLGEPTKKFNLVVTQEYHPYTPAIPIVLKNRSSKSSRENENCKTRNEIRQLPQVGNKTPIDIGLTTYNQIDNVPNTKNLGNFRNQPNLEVCPQVILIGQNDQIEEPLGRPNREPLQEEDLEPINKPDLNPIRQPINSNRLLKGHRAKLVGIMQGISPYDLLEDLEKVKADITIKKLLEITPQCRSILQANLIRKRAKLVVNKISLSPDPGAPTINVQIDGIIVIEVQIDGGSSVNVMNRDTMLSLHLIGFQETKLVLRMADQSQVKPLGILPKIKTSISRIVYLIDFIVFQSIVPLIYHTQSY